MPQGVLPLREVLHAGLPRLPVKEHYVNNVTTILTQIGQYPTVVCYFFRIDLSYLSTHDFRNITKFSSTFFRLGGKEYTCPSDILDYTS